MSNVTPEVIANYLIGYWQDGIKEDLEKGLIQKEEDIRARINHKFFIKNYENYRIYNEVLIGRKQKQGKKRNWKLVDTVIFKDKKDENKITEYYPSILIEYKCWSTDFGDLDKFKEIIEGYKESNKTKLPNILLFFAIWDDRKGEIYNEFETTVEKLKIPGYKYIKPESKSESKPDPIIKYQDENNNANKKFEEFFYIYHKHYYQDIVNIDWIFKLKNKIEKRKIIMTHAVFKQSTKIKN